MGGWGEVREGGRMGGGKRRWEEGGEVREGGRKGGGKRRWEDGGR